MKKERALLVWTMYNLKFLDILKPKWRDWKEGVKDDSFRCQYEEITRKSWCICKSLRYRSNCVLKVIWVASRRDLPFQLLCYIAKEMRYEIQRIWLEVIICKLVVLLKPANIKTCFVFWQNSTILRLSSCMCWIFFLFFNDSFLVERVDMKIENQSILPV